MGTWERLFGVFVSLVLVSFSCAASEQVPAWLVGTWTPTFDEDGTPADVASFTADGKYYNYGIGCSVFGEMRFHIHNGDIYITSEVPGKGPIAQVFRPSENGRKLTYTSPRTRNNAVMEKLDSNPCSHLHTKASAR